MEDRILFAYLSIALLILVVGLIPIALFIPLSARTAKGIAWFSLISLVLVSLSAAWLSH